MFKIILLISMLFGSLYSKNLKNNYTIVLAYMKDMNNVNNIISNYLVKKEKEVFVKKYKEGFLITYGAFSEVSEANDFKNNLSPKIQELYPYVSKLEYNLLETEEEKTIKPKIMLKEKVMKKNNSINHNYTLVLAYMENISNMEKLSARYLKGNTKKVFFIKHKEGYLVTLGAFNSKKETDDFKDTLSSKVKSLNPYTRKFDYNLLKGKKVKIKQNKQLLKLKKNNIKIKKIMPKYEMVILSSKDKEEIKKIKEKAEKKVITQKKKNILPKLEVIKTEKKIELKEKKVLLEKKQQKIEKKIKKKEVKKVEKTNKKKLIKEIKKVEVAAKVKKEKTVNKKVKLKTPKKMKSTFSPKIEISLAYSPLEVENKFSHKGNNKIDLEKDLGLKGYNHTLIPQISVMFGKNTIYGSYLYLKNTDNETISKDIVLNNYTFNNAEKLSTSYITSWLTLGYKYTYNSKKIGLDIHNYKNKLELSNTSNETSLEKDFTFPALSFEASNKINKFSLLYGGSYGFKPSELKFYNYFVSLKMNKMLFNNTDILLGYKNQTLDIDASDYDGKTHYSGVYIKINKIF